MISHGAQVDLYENERGIWILKVGLTSVDSAEGLAAYMAVILRNNAVVRTFRLSRVVELWNVSPGDGNIYFACALCGAL
jgi:hypothetical protein